VTGHVHCPICTPPKVTAKFASYQACRHYNFQRIRPLAQFNTSPRVKIDYMRCVYRGSNLHTWVRGKKPPQPPQPTPPGIMVDWTTKSVKP